jgi:quercetin dioxygenase-like cupin family protein
MRTISVIATTALVITGLLTFSIASAQQPGIKRTDFPAHDLSIPGREASQVLVEFAPGASFPRHSHPGEELVYVVEGTLEYALDGRAPAALKAGDVLFIPAGTPHAVRNVGSTKATELGTYIVEKGKPLLVLSKAGAN